MGPINQNVNGFGATCHLRRIPNGSQIFNVIIIIIIIIIIM